MTDRKKTNLKSPAKPSQSKKVVRQAVRTQLFKGPIPPPQVLQQYEHIVPGAAERILKMAETQSKHRQTMERNIVNANISNEKKGLVFGFSIGLFAIIVGLICTLLGQPLPASFIGGGGVIGLVVVFVYGSKSRKPKTNK